jgi:hypothetical protein
MSMSAGASRRPESVIKATGGATKAIPGPLIVPAVSRSGAMSMGDRSQCSADGQPGSDPTRGISRPDAVGAIGTEKPTRQARRLLGTDGPQTSLKPDTDGRRSFEGHCS